MNGFAELNIAGRVATPDDSDWDSARAAWNLTADQQPVAVAFAESADDVSAVVSFATKQGLKVAGQGTGHGAAALGPLGDTILLKTERMRGVGVDADSQTATIGAGVLVEEVGAAAQAEGMCSMPGSSPNVGVVGYTLGGGLSWLGRRHGFACNRVNAIDVVTALHVDLLPISEVYAGALVFPAELGADALRTYRDWAASVSEDVTSIARFLRPPPLPDVPEPLRDRPLLTFDAACIGSREEGEATIAPLRELGEPILDTFGQIPAEGLSRIHMDPEPPVPGLGHHRLLAELPDDAVEAFVGAAGPEAGSPLLLAEVRQLGGALARPAENGGALSSLDAEFAMFGIGMPMTPELGQAIGGALDQLHDTMEPWAADGGYFNFAERPCDVDAILPAETCSRLREVTDRWDHDGVIVANHALSVAPA